jgi:predicted patatin/cPLA2 family phospholipase
MTKTKIGVVLSGGGAKGAYEVGFLKHFQSLIFSLMQSLVQV